MPTWGYEFTCARSLSEMESLLNQAGPWQWAIRDCAWYPDFLQSRPEAGIRVCIFETEPPGGPTYRSVCEISPSSGSGRAAIDPILLSLLAHLPARPPAEIVPAIDWPFD